jgi:hypothetical protein
MGHSTDLKTDNQTYLILALEVLRAELEMYMAKNRNAPKSKGVLNRIFNTNKAKNDAGLSFSKAKQALENAHFNLEQCKQNLPVTSALDALSSIFGLSPFEKKLVLLCAGMDLDARFNKTVVKAMQSNGKTQPNFSLALAALEGANWTALSPNAPLRYWRIIELTDNHNFTNSGLKLDERILNFLLDIPYLDPRLSDQVSIVRESTVLTISQMVIVQAIREALTSQHNQEYHSIIQLTGTENADKLLTASVVAQSLGLILYQFPLHTISTHLKEVRELALFWSRESALHPCALFIDASALDMNDKMRLQLLTNFLENLRGSLFLNNDQWTPTLNIPLRSFSVLKPSSAEQLKRWQLNLGTAADPISDELDQIVAQFNLGAKSIDNIANEAILSTSNSDLPLDLIIWNKCKYFTRPKIDELAQYIEPIADWEQLVLPEMHKKTLREISMQVRLRNKVYKEWGFGEKGNRGLGISALFAGESGTGKTMASEVIANDLNLDLYRIDLSQVVNKYIGETEKNLKRIFDAAEDGGAILLFDEADALFGKRSDVKDSHDRYSNIEVSYLLQRMETYKGLAILTTNMKNALDKSFMRRIRFAVNFPHPDAELRVEIWRKVFPKLTPLGSLDYNKLARLNIPGGNIKNIALNAAFLAANDKKHVEMRHIAQAVRNEYAKIEKSLSINEIAGWE